MKVKITIIILLFFFSCSRSRKEKYNYIDPNLRSNIKFIKEVNITKNRKYSFTTISQYMKNKQVSSCDIYLNDEFDQTEEGLFLENGDYMYGYKVNEKFNGFIANKVDINNLNFCYYSSGSLYMNSKSFINNGLLKLRVNKYIDSNRVDSLHYIYNKSDLIKIVNGDNLKYLYSNYKYDSFGNWIFREVKRYDSDTTFTQYSSNRYIKYYSDN